jgi:hypothetical protein
MITVFLAPTAELAHSRSFELTVEAEYGSDVVLGSVFTAAHHQKEGLYSSKESPAPCNNTKIPWLLQGSILLSHLDLDSIGGTLRAVEGPESGLFLESGFWHLAEFVDLNGPHRLMQAKAEDVDLARLWAFWAWLRTHQPHYERTGLMDVTGFIQQAAGALKEILADNKEFLEKGETLKKSEGHLNQVTFIRKTGAVILRHADNVFCNHLYQTAEGESAEAVVAWDRISGSITISIASPWLFPKVSCRELVQKLWGPLAGGHQGIAGSPRGVFLQEGEAERAVTLLEQELAGEAGIERVSKQG